MQKQEMGPHEEDQTNEVAPIVADSREQATKEFEGIYARSDYSREYLEKMLDQVDVDILKQRGEIDNLTRSVEHLAMQKQAMENLLAKPESEK